jgi:predicted dehydrogenase
MDFNPASVAALTQLMEGGLYIQHPGWAPTSPAQGGALLHCRLRYFDPARQRAGIPEDVAALIDTMTDDAVTVTLVNANDSDSRLVTVQAGAYGEHNVISVSDGARTQPVNDRSFAVRLAPGAGTKLTVKMKRFANQPTLCFPWDTSA